jgi:cysteine synthase A
MQSVDHGAESLKAVAEVRGRIYDDMLDTIGATPMVRLSKFKEKYGLEADIVAKLEFFNPLASVKDRIAFGMIEGLEREGRIVAGQTVLVEPTSGNTGIGLAFVAAVKGYKLILTMPESMSVERRKMLALLGAELELTPADKGMKGAIARADEIVREMQGEAVLVGQFSNPGNPQIHRETTAEEIWQDSEGRADILVAGVGTGGTLTGVAQILKQRKPEFMTYAVEPKDSPVLSGGEAGPHKIQGIGAGFVPEVLETELIDGIIQIGNDEAIAMAREIARLEGLPVGISSGAALQAAIEVARKPEHKGKMIVVILPSFAERYLSTALFDGL